MLNLNGNGVPAPPAVSGEKRVYLACGRTDMRKSINGLAGIVEQSFELDLYGGAVFAFCNRTRDRIKILEWDGDGFWLYFKRLEKGRFRWPTEGTEMTLTLSTEELAILLGGAKVERKLRRDEVTERVAV
jgi:transposase